jgi:gliding motility-associated lipoprotein GldK
MNMKKIVINTVKKALSFSPTVKTGLMLGILTLAGCKASDRGELLGVQGRSLWFHPTPIGMVYVPTGTIHTGASEQDVFNSYLMPNKQVTITAFWMDETEITNNEYRQFVNWVIDSIAREMVDEDALFNVNDDTGERSINWDEELDWEEYVEELEDMFYPEEERFNGDKQIDTRKLFYRYMWIDFKKAAAEDRDKYNARDRRNFIRKERTLIYPDTLCWVRDYTYSYNEPMVRHYFNHEKYDDYPVVGVNWHQAKAFCNWRSLYKENYWRNIGNVSRTEDFRLPHEYEWEYAARGGRDANMYPWGGPYTRNSKGCMLANFKPLRSNYGADGGVYPVRVDSYFPNDYGLYNMAGNVAEWTKSTYAEAAASFQHDLNPAYETDVSEFVHETETEEGFDEKPFEVDNVWEQENFVQEGSSITKKRKVIRGGSWKDVAHFIQCGTRTYDYQDTSKCYIGFRTIQSYIGRSNKDKK